MTEKKGPFLWSPPRREGSRWKNAPPDQTLPGGLCDYRFILENVLRRSSETYTNLCGFSVDIVLPVYNCAQALEKLFPGLEHTSIPYRLIIVDDASTDQDTVDFIDRYAACHTNVKMIRNERNLGMVKSINRGLVMTRTNCVILNADVSVPDYWLERLISPLVKDDSVCCAVPFSNNSSICGFPDQAGDSEIFHSLTASQIDPCFLEVRSLYTTIPQGDTFCVALNKSVMRKIGILNQEYSETPTLSMVEWCLRAHRQGYRTAAVENLYVDHGHTRVQSNPDRKNLTAYAARSFLEQYPDYQEVLDRFRREDPLHPIRAYVFARLSSSAAQNRNLIITGSAAGFYDRTLRREALSQSTLNAFVHYDPAYLRYVVSAQYHGHTESFSMQDLGAVFHFADHIGVNTVLINDLQDYPDVFEHLDAFSRYAQKSGARLIFCVVNYFCLCPNATLLGENGQYCGLPAVADCEKCFQAIKRGDCPDTTIAQWREHFALFLRNTQEIRIFSENSSTILSSVFGTLFQLHKVDVPISRYLPLRRTRKTRKTIQIAVFGPLTKMNGGDQLHRFSEICLQKNLPVHFVLFGENRAGAFNSRVTHAGTVAEEELPHAMLEYDIDVVLDPSPYPKVAVPSLEMAKALGLLACCEDLGSQREALIHYEKGYLLPQGPYEQKLQGILDFYMQNMQQLFTQQEPDKDLPLPVLIVADGQAAASPMAQNVLKEQLYSSGFSCETVSQKVWLTWKTSSYSSFILCDPVFSKAENRLIKASVRQKKRCHAMISSENVFPPSSSEWKSISRFAVPSEKLKKSLEEHYPGASVKIVPPACPYSLQVLCDNARQYPRPQSHEAVIAIMLSSDPEPEEKKSIEDGLLEILSCRQAQDKFGHDPVYIRLIGPMELPDSLLGYEKRIEIFPAAELSEIPSLLTNVRLAVSAYGGPDKNPYQDFRGFIGALLEIPVIGSSEEYPYEWPVHTSWVQEVSYLLLHPGQASAFGHEARKTVLTHYSTGKEMDPYIQKFLSQEEKKV